MLKQLNTYIASRASGRNVVLALVLAQSIFALMIFYTIPKLERLSGGMKILDLMPTGYRSSYIKSLFEQLGSAGRDIYLYQQLALDTAYPLLLAISLAFLMAYIFKKAFAADSILHHLAALPFLAGLFDYLENISIFIMLKLFPTLPTALTQAASLFTILKSLTTTMCFILLIAGTIAIIKKKIIPN